MKLKKQLDTLKCLESGCYRVIDGDVYTKTGGGWRIMSPHTLPSGYMQMIISNHRRGVENVRVVIYKHILCYMAENGAYPVGWEIDHIDRDKKNTMPDNLRAVPPVVNCENKDAREFGEMRPIRGLEIDNIRTLWKGGCSQSDIARQLNLNRLSVRRVMKIMEAGGELKFDGIYKKKHDF